MATLIHFTADRLLDGLLYHLRQFQPSIEKITPDSLLHVHRVVTRSQITADVSEWDWKHWSDHDRLKWIADTLKLHLVEVPAEQKDAESCWELRFQKKGKKLQKSKKEDGESSE